MTFDPDNPAAHKPAHKPGPKHKAAPKKARNEWWRVTGPVYTGPLRKYVVVKEGKCVTWILNED